MADMPTIAAPGLQVGQTDRLGLFLKMFTGEVLTAFSQATVTGGKFSERTIEHGKSALFPRTWMTCVPTLNTMNVPL